MVKDIGVDKVLIISVILLLMFGLIMTYSSTMILAKEKYGDSFYFLKRQLLWLLIGLSIFVFLTVLRYPLYLNSKIILLALVLSIAGLTAVFFMGRINNTFRWITFGGLSIQPSEFAKIAVVLYLSYHLSRRKFNVNHIKRLFLVLLPIIVVQLLILKEPDYGTFFLISMVMALLLFVAGFRLRYLMVVALIISLALVAIIKLNPQRMNRVMAYLHPEEYVSTHGFQATQSIYAIGSGGIFGQGLGKSTQKLFFLPYAYTDFIYAIIGEEVGLIGSLLILGLFFLLLVRGLRIAKQSGNIHAYLLVVGLTFLLVSQAFINISVTLGLLPTKGIPLPFISVGGSSMLSSLIIAGIIANVSRHRRSVFIND